tara:strand:- start:7467 stop:8006 length:540 start_codon:yes stop_codon:yes gene_type:complete
MPRKWKTIETKSIFGNKVFGLREDKVLSPKTDNTHPVWVIDAPTWVNIIPLTKENKIIMVKQYRFGNREISLEIPGGMVEPEEDPLLAAKREMEEETGYSADEILEIGKISPNPAFMSNYLFTYVANNVEKIGDQKLDDMEDIEVLEVDLNRIPTLITEGKIDHSLVISAFYLLNQFEL